MGGPIVNFELGYKSSITCASRCAVECQKAFFPCLSFHLKNFMLPSIKSFGKYGLESIAIIVSVLFSFYLEDLRVTNEKTNYRFCSNFCISKLYSC